MKRASQLVDLYDAAYAHYEAGWKHIDDVLRPVVVETPWDTVEDIFVKVVFVDGVYRAGLVRTLGRQARWSCAQLIFEAANPIQEAISELRQYDERLTADAAVAAIGAHKLVLGVLERVQTEGDGESEKKAGAGDAVPSFASKISSLSRCRRPNLRLRRDGQEADSGDEGSWSRWINGAERS